MDRRVPSSAQLVVGAGLGASALAARVAVEATRLLLAVPLFAMDTATRIPEVHRGMVNLERIWLTLRNDLIEAVSKELDRVVPAAAGAALDRLDLNQLVAERVDLNAVAERIDIERLMERIDLVAIARGLIDELDLPEIIRDSSGTMALETLDGLRVQTMKADQWVARVVDRLLRRDERSPEGPRVIPPLAPPGTGPSPS